MHHSPVAILQNKRHGREYRASSLSQSSTAAAGGITPGGSAAMNFLGSPSGATPSSLSSSYIDHAFDHPTPTSFSQLQFLSSSVASNDGSDYTHRVPKVEEKFCSGFHCCGLELDDLHHLLEHFEECHVLTGQPDPNNLPAPLANAAFEASSQAADGPQFDDFDEEEEAAKAGSAAAAAGGKQGQIAGSSNAGGQQMPQLGAAGLGSGAGTGPTLSAPPSPAMSSYSDNFPAGHPGNTLYDLKGKQRRNVNGSTQSPFSSGSAFSKGKSTSPPSDNDEAVSMTSEDEGNRSHHLPFTRKSRQQSVDSIASVSTNASTSSKKRSFGAAMGAHPGTASPLPNAGNPSMLGNTTTAAHPSALSATRGRTLGPGGIDLSTLRGVTPSAISTPDSSVPGTPASDYAGAGCLPPSLLFPFNANAARNGQDEEEMTTDEDEDELGMGFDDDDDGQNSQGYGNYDFDGSGAEDGNEMDESGHQSKRTRKGNNQGSARRRAGYDSLTDQQAAAMFSPLSLLGSQQHQNNGQMARGTGEGGHISVPTVPNSTSPSSQARASAATLAAIQAAAAANGLNTASTPTGRIWIPNNAKPFKCPVPGCDKAYKQQNGLKYHRLHGHCNSNSVGKEGEDTSLAEEDKPFGCYVGPACGKKYKNMNGLRYHYQHSGAHGQIGLQMLSNGTHPPPAYPPGHKRSANSKANLYSEFASSGAPTVVMNQSTAEALLAAISTQPGGASAHQQQLLQQAQMEEPQQGFFIETGSRSGSRPATPRIGTPSNSRGSSPAQVQRQRMSPQRQGSQTSFPTLPLGLGVGQQ